MVRYGQDDAMLSLVPWNKRAVLQKGDVGSLESLLYQCLEGPPAGFTSLQNGRTLWFDQIVTPLP